MNSSELQARLIDFSSTIAKELRKLEADFVVRRMQDQIFRSTTSIALNYAEAREAESKKDFLHKQRLCLKEARESYVAIQILMATAELDESKWKSLLAESSEILAMFSASVRTIKRKIDTTP